MRKLLLILWLFTAPILAQSYQLFEPYAPNTVNPSTQAQISNDGFLLRADSLILQPPYLIANNQVQMSNQELQLRSSKIIQNTDSKQFLAIDAAYAIPKSQLNGQADQIFVKSNVYSYLQDATISTCPARAHSDQLQDWHLEASQIELNFVDGWANADSLWLKVKGVPILYLPVLQFPIDDRRKSGFLYPSIGISSIDGNTLKVPFYWHIANNADLLTTPTWIENRGIWLANHLRYLSPYSFTNIYAEQINNDQINQSNRDFFGWHQRGRLDAHWYFAIDYNRASDKDYFRDFESDVHKRDTSHLNQKAQLNFSSTYFNAALKHYDFQTLGYNTTETYASPSSLSMDFQPWQFITLSAEQSKFTHNDQTKVMGTRQVSELMLKPSLEGNFYEISGGVHMQKNKYTKLTNIHEAEYKSEAKTSILDATIFFERSLDNDWLQTLEPQLYAAKRRLPNETHLPNFDSNAIDLSYNSLFDHQTYSGKDRVGALDRVSFGLTSQFITKHKTAISLQLAQGYDKLTDEKTDGVAAMTLNLKSWQLDSSFQLDPGFAEVKKNTSSLTYHPTTQKNIGLGYKKDTSQDLNELTLKTRWSVGKGFQIFGVLEQSDDTIIKNSYGIAYTSCCWELLLSRSNEAKNYQNTAGDPLEYERKFYLTIGIIGLSNSVIDRTISQIIQ